MFYQSGKKSSGETYLPLVVEFIFYEMIYWTAVLYISRIYHTLMILGPMVVEYLWFLEWQAIWKHWIYVIVTVLSDMFWDYYKAETFSDCNKKTKSQTKVRCSLYRLVLRRWLVTFQSAIPEVSCFSVGLRRQGTSCFCLQTSLTS